MCYKPGKYSMRPTLRFLILERQIGQTEDAINILLGKYPDNVPRAQPLGIETPTGWNWSETLPPQLPTGLPSELLEGRPDIREAEQNLVAANANIGVAKAMFFPQISLLGSGGAAFGHSQFAGSNIPAPLGVGTYAAALSQPIFEGGALRNNLRYAKSQERQALIGYQQTIQRAFGDVSDALIGYDKYHKVRERQEQSVKDLQDSVNVSLMRYRGGTSNYLEVLDSQRSLFGAELTLAEARNNCQLNRSMQHHLIEVISFRGGVNETRKTVWASCGAEDLYMAPLEGGRIVAMRRLRPLRSPSDSMVEVA